MPLNYLQKTINTVTDDVIIPGDLEVQGNLSVDGTLAVTGAATFSSTLAAGNTTITGTLNTSGLATLNSAAVTTTLSSGGLATLNSAAVTTTLSTGGLATLNSAAVTTTLSSGGLATLNSASITTTLGVTGIATFSSTLTASTLYESQAVTNITQQAYQILTTDRLITLSTTGAGGPFAITFPVSSLRIRVSLVMIAFNTATFQMDTIAGTFVFAGVGDCATVVNAGGGVWYLDGAGISNAP